MSVERAWRVGDIPALHLDYERVRGRYPFNCITAFALPRPYDQAALQRAVDLVSQTQPILTARLVGDLFHAIADSRSVVQTTQVADQDELHALIDAQDARTFDRSTGPLWDLTQVVVGDSGTAVGVLTADHLMADMQSLQSLSRLVGQALVGEPLDPVPVHSEFVEWQEQWQRDPDNKAMAFWTGLREKYGPPTMVDLSFMRDDARAGTTVLGTTTTVPEDRLHVVGSIAAALRTTPFVVRLAAVAWVLRDAHQGEATPIRVTVPARPRGFEGTIGWFAHDIVAYVASQDRTFEDVVRSVHATWFATLPHIFMPMRIVDSAAASQFRVGEFVDVTVAVNDRTRYQPDDVEPVHQPEGFPGTERGLRIDFTGPHGRFVTCHHDPGRFRLDSVDAFLRNVVAVMTTDIA